MGILYKLTFPNGKAYIGITTESLRRRIQRHINYARANRQYALSAAIRKYGEGSFSAEIIGQADTWEELLALETNAVKTYNTLCPNGYNMTGGGEGSFGVVPNDEKRKKISASLIGRKLTESHKKAIGVAQIGKTIPMDVCEKMRASAIKRCSLRPMSDEQKQKIRASLLGKKQSPERIAKRVAARLANGSY